MTMDHWLMIALIISTLIAPALGPLIESRIKRPIAIPDASQPRKRGQSIGARLKAHFKRYWFSEVGMLWDFTLLTYLVVRPIAITPLSVALISFTVASLATSLLQISVFKVLRLIKSVVALQELMLKGLKPDDSKGKRSRPPNKLNK